MCVCDRERECVFVREREGVCVCVCEREREREKSNYSKLSIKTLILYHLGRMCSRRQQYHATKLFSESRSKLECLSPRKTLQPNLIFVGEAGAYLRGEHLKNIPLSHPRLSDKPSLMFAGKALSLP